ncbi:MAG: hypothetical protein SO237_01165, partial [Erysipelotrichaceae bacterium]|nr:hypothetical protein [Erysipelotrichaceae bacterium]
MEKKRVVDVLQQFSCAKNLEIEKFVKNNAIDFAKKKISITYLVVDGFLNRLCHNKQLINSHFYRGVSELPYKLLFAVIYTHLEFRYEMSHTITSHH